MRIAWRIASLPLVSFALLSGCSAEDPGDPAKPTFESGTRLRARVADGGDGAVLFEAWVDTKLNELCEFNVTKDGSFRCVPAYWGPRLVYTDPACSTPAAAVDQTCEVGSNKFVTSIDEAYVCPGAPAPVTVYSLGAPLGNKTAYYRDERGGCAEYGVDVPLVEVTEAPLDTFVAATVGREELGDGFSTSVLLGEDGSRILHRVHDPAGGECWPARLGDSRTGEAYPCVPAGWITISSYGPYADATCEQPLKELPASCPKPTLAVVEEKREMDCVAGERTLREVGAAATPMATYSYSRYTGSCSPSGVAPTPGATFYAVGEPVATDAYPTLTWSASGAGRLRGRHWATQSGAQASVPWGYPLSSSFYDEALKITCYGAEFADGTTRCIPLTRDLGASELFADPACKEPINADFLSGAQCPADYGSLLYAKTEPSTACGAGLPITALYKVGAPHAGKPLYYLSSEHGCQDWSDLTEDVYTLEPVDPATYAEITVRVE